jgi:lipoprotein NlpI
VAQAAGPSAEELAQAAERKRASLVDRIDRFTKEIDSGRLQGKDLAEVFRLRGIAYSHLTQNDRAAEDLSKAIELDPFNPQYYEDRAITYLKLREFAKAQTDLAMALGLDRKRPTAYREEGRLASYQGEHARAARSFALSMEHDSGMGVVYSAIWLHIAVTRGALNAPSPLPPYAAALPPTQWPAPVIQMLIGTIQPDQAIALADAPDADTYRAQKCEAYFYAGEHYLAQQKADAARVAFEAAAATGVTDFLEYDWALRELELMKASR